MKINMKIYNMYIAEKCIYNMNNCLSQGDTKLWYLGIRNCRRQPVILCFLILDNELMICYGPLFLLFLFA